MDSDSCDESIPDALSAQDFTWMYNSVNNRSRFQTPWSGNTSSSSGLTDTNRVAGPRSQSLTATSAHNPTSVLNSTSALAPLPGWKGQEDLQRQSAGSSQLHSGAFSREQSAGVSQSTVIGWKNKLGVQLERAMVKPQDQGLGSQGLGINQGLGSQGLGNQGLGNQHARTVTSPALAPWPPMMSGAPWIEPAMTSAATSTNVTDSFAEEIRQMQQEMQGYGGFAPGETSTEALLAELHALQASMEVPGDSPQGLEHRHREHVNNAVRSFSLDHDEGLGFSLDNSYTLDDILMASSPPPETLPNPNPPNQTLANQTLANQTLSQQTSGVSLLDNYLLGTPDGAYSFYQAPQITPPARLNPNRPIPAPSNQNRPIGNVSNLAQAVPSPLDLINKDFVSSFFSSGNLASVPDRGGSPATFPQANLPPPQPHAFGRSTSLGQASETSPADPDKKRLFPFATFSTLDRTKRPNAVRSDSDSATSMGVLINPSPITPSLQSTEPGLMQTQPDSKTTGSGSRLVSAAEIMQALNRLPPRMSHRDFVKSANPRVNQTNPSPQSHKRARSVSSGLSTLCLQDVNAPELFVQMSDEKLVSTQVRALRGGYVSELAELRGWCMENLSEVVVPLVPGVHYLACNALPPARFKVARLMMSKVTLWIRQFQHNVRSISPVDLYMFIHEAARVFLDSDLSLLANIPSQEARDGFEKIYLVMEKMKKEACEGLRFSDADVHPIKPNADVKPRVTNPVSDRVSDSGLGLSSDGSGSGLGGSGLGDNLVFERKPGLGEDGVSSSGLGQTSGSGSGADSGLAGESFGRNKRKVHPESTEGLKKRLGFTNQLGNKGSEQQRQWLKGLQHELTKLNENEGVVMFNANPGGLAPVRRFVSEAGLMAKYNLRMASWRLLAAASEKFDTLAKGVLPSFEKYLGFSKYILGTCVGLTMAFCAIAGRQTQDGKWEPKAEALQSLLERTKKGTELAAELACIMTDLRTYEEDLLKLRVNSVGVMMREGGRSQQDAVALLEQRAETILTALVAEVTSPPANNPVLWTCWQLIFDFSRAQVAFHVVDDLDAKVERFFEVKDGVKG